LQHKLDLYSEGGEKQFFKIQTLKKSYLNQVREQQDIRSKVDINFAHGIRTGLPHAPYDSIKNYREDYDQKLRDQIVAEAKVEYRKHENLGKKFNDSKRPYERMELGDEKSIPTEKTYSSKSLIKSAFDKVKRENGISNSPAMHNTKGLSKYFSSPSNGFEYSKNRTREDKGMNR
jgi:hypothetical protein